MIDKNEVLLVGSYPPPYGGCSVHIQRLQKSLAEKFNIKALDLYSNETAQDRKNHVCRCGNKLPINLIKAILALLDSNAGLIHFHVAAMGNFLFAGFLLLLPIKSGVKKVITIHSGSFVKNFASVGLFKRKLLLGLLRKFDHIIVVNAEQKVMIGKLGINGESITVAPAFLPPIAKAAVDIVRSLDDLRTGGRRIIVSSGYALPYYGFHVLLDAIISNAEYRKDVSVVLCFYNTYDQKYLAEIELKLKNVRHAVFRDLDPDEFSYVLSKSDIYVRATDRDGDAVAIREAAFFGKKIVASDCVERPAGSILFDLNNVVDLDRALAQALHDANAGIVTFDYYDNLKKIDAVYKKLLNIGVDNETNITKP